jgi:thioredoxin reductase (NADPH)
MQEDYWDLIICGAGPAGLTAGIYSARSGLNTLLLEKSIPGGCINEAFIIENYPGFSNGISGQELAKKMVKQCKNAGAEIHTMEKVKNIEIKNKKKFVITEKKVYQCNAVIVATGTKYRTLGLQSEEKFRGAGISYCAVCDGPLFKDKDVLVIGGGNCAVIDALYLKEITSSVTLIHRSKSLRAEKVLVEEIRNKGIEILLNTEVKSFKGNDRLKSVLLSNNKNGNSFEMKAEGAFIDIGRIPNTDFLKGTGIDIENGYIVVDEKKKTNIEGVFAGGDVTKCPYKQIGKAVGDAIVASLEVFGYIKNPYYYNKIHD